MNEDEHPPQPLQPEKKGLGPVAWILIGCGSLVAIVAAAVLVLVLFVADQAREIAAGFENEPAMAAAEMIVRLNPELELEGKDVEGQTLTVRNTNTGQIVTVNVHDIREGKISFETEDGTSSIQIDPHGGGATVSSPQGSTTLGGDGALLPWVPRYPAADYKQVQKSDIPQGIITIFSVRSRAAADEVLGFYSRHYEELGWEVRRVDVPGAESTVFVVAPDKAAKLNVSMADLGEAGSAGMLRANQAQP